MDRRCFDYPRLVPERRGRPDHNLEVLAGLKTNEALVPFLWTYEVANGLVMAQRRRRLADSDITTILGSLRTLPITVDSPDADRVWRLPVLAIKHRLTAYDSAYIELALRLKLPIATKDSAMKTSNEFLGHRDG